MTLFALDQVLSGLFGVKLTLDLEGVFQLLFVLGQLDGKFAVDILQRGLYTWIQTCIRKHFVIDLELVIES